jgi:APA family basic amino acid/polyamine antiporter
VAHGWSHYFQDFIGIFHLHLPKALTIAPFDYDVAGGRFFATGSVFDLPAIVITAIVTLILVRASARAPPSTPPWWASSWSSCCW